MSSVLCNVNKDKVISLFPGYLISNSPHNFKFLLCFYFLLERDAREKNRQKLATYPTKIGIYQRFYPDIRRQNLADLRGFNSINPLSF